MRLRHTRLPYEFASLPPSPPEQCCPSSCNSVTNFVHQSQGKMNNNHCGTCPRQHCSGGEGGRISSSDFCKKVMSKYGIWCIFRAKNGFWAKNVGAACFLPKLNKNSYFHVISMPKQLCRGSPQEFKMVTQKVVSIGHP